MSERTEGRPPGGATGGVGPGPTPPPGGFPGMPPGLNFPDPFTFWKQWYDTNEQAWSKALEQMVGTPEYAQTMGKTMEAFLAFQRSVRDNMRLYLESVNLPTREDIARLGEQIVHLEEKIDDLDDRVDELMAAVRRLDTAAGAKATPDPRLDEVLAALKGLQASASADAVRGQLDALASRLDAIQAAVKDGARPASGGRRGGAEPAATTPS